VPALGSRRPGGSCVVGRGDGGVTSDPVARIRELPGACPLGGGRCPRGSCVVGRGDVEYHVHIILRITFVVVKHYSRGA
jgi:hypothetical protein